MVGKDIFLGAFITEMMTVGAAVYSKKLLFINMLICGAFTNFIAHRYWLKLIYGDLPLMFGMLGPQVTIAIFNNYYCGLLYFV